MKKIFISIWVVITLLLMTIGVGLADINEGLVAYYPFNGDANDESGNGHHGSLKGPSLTYDRFGNVNGAYSFDGINDMIIVPDKGDFNTGGELTIALWINFLSEPPCTPTSFVSKSAWMVGSNSGYIFPYVGYSACGDFGLITYTNYWNFKRSFSYYSIPDPYSWHFYAATYKSGERKVYLDGELVAIDSQNANYPIRSNSNNLAIGNQPGTQEWAHAEMDDIRIYNRALSDAEIQELFNQKPEVIEADLQIEPGTLNLKSNGNWITVYIELPDAYYAENINVSSVALSKINGSMSGSPLYAVGPSEIGDYDGNNISDLMVKIDRQRLIELLGKGNAELTLSGELIDGAPFEGSSLIKVIDKGRK
ncbi:MAG: LamG domain-containing protein [Deltaproteobacteria bacterium]|nr:LamG domain-containing protein [Deltaproteobacteria bacterium]